MNSSIENIELEYNGKTVKGKKLSNYSELPIKLEDAWNEVQKSILFEFVAEGMLSFKPIGSKFPEIWEENSNVKTKKLLWGIIPFGGIHSLKFIKVDSKKKILLTQETNNVAKIWNHKISMKKLKNENVEYKDEIEIYGGVLTNIVTLWARMFYRHRQKRWLIIAKRISEIRHNQPNL